jgi:cyclophilin family peptidyl-prolyl cis-trans isomerase/HEAT repeat protein
MANQAHTNISLIIIAFVIIITGCIPVKKEAPPTPPIELIPDFNQNIQQIIYTWQDKLMTDSLLLYFKHENEILRYLAVRALGSVKDPAALNELFSALRDSSLAVKAAAAFAIGQIGDIRGEKPLTDAFINFDSVPGFDHLNAVILESIGKCASAASLKLISEVSTFLPTDTLLLLGQARAIYKFGNRNIFHPSGTECMVKFIKDKRTPHGVRLIAAHYLHRFPDIDLSAFSDDLANLWEAENDTLIRMCLITAIVKSNPTENFDFLNRVLSDSDEDYRVWINALKALVFLEDTQAEKIVSQHLKSKHPLSTWQAAQHFLYHGRPGMGSLYRSLIDSTDSNHSETRITLVAAASKFTPPTSRLELEDLAGELDNLYTNETSPAVKRMAVLAMGHNTNCLVPLKNILTDLQTDVIYRSAAAEALAELAVHPYFQQAYRGSSTDVKIFIAKYLALAAKSVEEGITAAAASGLRNPKAGLRLYISDTINWDHALQKLVLPTQSEDYIEILRLKKYIAGQSNDINWKPTYNHPIEWDQLRSISDTMRAVIKTSKGDIHIRFMKNYAPATVLTFYKLVKNGYYTGKLFHRVVPNFVIQGGCNRGDGYGSLDFSLRSELPMVYYDHEGYVGMASAGNHTESQQFFITQSPTPHLDGNYTIFARVIEGMDVVHRIRPGDRIETIEIIE